MKKVRGATKIAGLSDKYTSGTIFDTGTGLKDTTYWAGWGLSFHKKAGNVLFFPFGSSRPRGTVYRRDAFL